MTFDLRAELAQPPFFEMRFAALLRRLTVLLAVLFAMTGARAEPTFSVDALPEHTRNAPVSMDLTSPRATVWSFLSAVRDDAHQAAAAALGPTGRRTESPEDLARMLGAVIERQLWIDLAALSDRRDAAVEPPGRSGRLGETRRSVTLGTLDVGGRPVTIRLVRLQPEEGDAKWLFAEHTVEAIPELHDRYGPQWLERALPQWWSERGLWGLRRWEVAAAPALVVAAAAAGLLIWRLMRGGGARIGGLPRRALAAAAVPAALFAATFLVYTVMGSALAFSAPITQSVTPILIGLMALSAVMAALRVIDAGLEIVTHRYVGEIDDARSYDDRRFYTSIYALRRVVTLIAFAAGVGAVLWEMGIWSDIGFSLLASAGVLTVVLGIAGQTVLGNILASLQIAIAKPIRIGDSVSYEGQWAYVEAIFYTFVRLRTWDERRMIVPVKYFISHPFENWSMTDAKLTQTFWLMLDHEADFGRVRDKFLALAKEDEDALDEEEPKMLVLEHGERGARCRFYATARDPSTAWSMHARLQEALILWITETEPRWWPRERQRNVDEGAQRPSRAA